MLAGMTTNQVPWDSTVGALDAALGPDRRWSTWGAVERGARGPEPRPDWVVTADAAVDTELGVLKTGKEADVFLVERGVPDGASSLLAAKRYRSPDHRQFHRSSAYTEGRRVRRSRDQRALDRGTAHGRSVAAGQWARAEFEMLSSLWAQGASVPYPVQVDGTEVLMEFVGSRDGVAAPRLAQTRPDGSTLSRWYEQVRAVMVVLAADGFAHGDLSPYNVLADGDRVVVIDVPQAVDLAANPNAHDILYRDCRTMGDWFRSRGLDVDDGELFADLLSRAW
ncbi:RIO kinase 1 [Paraoerskovia marina]|uniref:non-specific serine/threonine protein kinase n=2 Tax=Paraoerskovia marina TaxID=545619 RepID=A0A1H1TC08_9CELL|nr:RIO kinase 1 [Paraoerskovia marina]